MNFTAIICCYILLPYFASLVSPPQESITCYAGIEHFLKSIGRLCCSRKDEEPPEEVSYYKSFIPEVHLEHKYFNQKLDHFHFNDLNTWRQRYIINDHHYQENGIIFIHIGTDENITEWNMQNGRWFYYCKSTNALCVGIERRGYGESLPNGNLKDENLKYLNTQQVLADVAWFIYNFRSLYTGKVLPKKLKWVAYGWSREGSLAAWLKMKYPHLVQAALSLSAPVLAKEDNDDYFKLIEEMLNTESLFKGEISNAFKQIREYVRDLKFFLLEKLFNFCTKHSLEDKRYRPNNTAVMYYLFAHTVATIMQYGNDEMASMKSKAIDIMLSDDMEKYRKLDSAIKRFGLLVRLNLKKYKKQCLETEYYFITQWYKLRVDGRSNNFSYLIAETLGNRTTLYQSCFEFGRFETLNDFFETNIQLIFFTKFCSDVFGEQYNTELLNQGVRRTNVFYGGLNIVVSRVIFVYGSDDPKRNLGVIDRHLEKSVVHILEGARHCNELDKYKSTNTDYDEQEIYRQLKEWLNLPENN